MTQDKTWRDAKIPKWVIESIESELDQLQLTAALSWPTEPRPEPAPFRWGGYGLLTGEPVPGVYYTIGRGVQKVEIRNKNESDTGWKQWRFKTESTGEFTDCVERGPLFYTEHDACLYLLWDECEKAAHRLMQIRKNIYGR